MDNRCRELRDAKKELEQIDEQLDQLKAKRRELLSRIERLKESDAPNKSRKGIEFFDHDNFEWSSKMSQLCSQKFNIKSFRSYQKPAINATMNGVDCLLIMPTGAGKSLCFQLPCLLKPGITVVISPLISLMEDQLRGMNELDIETIIFNAQSTKEVSFELMKKMIDPKSKLKLIYITPEKLAKSKRFMSQLEKMYTLGRFSRLVIDEVHCCSQWGHDFRPDYKFLGIMKNQFPDVPILGLTATATGEVIRDVQKILNIEGCLVFKDSFYRPNLRYQVIYSNTKDDSEKVAELIQSKFKGQSGIIYCLTVKETEDLAKKLAKLGIRASHYHAQMDPSLRSKIQEKWYSGSVSVIVATIAFGMGINKLDVRYIIHYSMSKSLENYYQETGRAGRDGLTAHCIMYYRFQDAFRATSLFFTEANALRIIYQMIRFCIDRQNCRKKLLAQYFGDPDCKCGRMCDNCESSYSLEEINASKYYQDSLKILQMAKDSKERVTPLKMIDAWLGKGSKKLRPGDFQKPQHSREICESILINLILEGYLKEEFHFTPYSTISYVVPGYKRSMAKDSPLKISVSTLRKTKSLSPNLSFESSFSQDPLEFGIKNKSEDSNDSWISGPSKKSKKPLLVDDEDSSDESSDDIIIESETKRRRSHENESPIFLD